MTKENEDEQEKIEDTGSTDTTEETEKSGSEEYRERPPSEDAVENGEVEGAEGSDLEAPQDVADQIQAVD